MEWNLKENNKQKHQFKSYYCLGCKQRKVCGKLNLEYCCPCFYQEEQEKAAGYNSYEEVLASKQIDREREFRQLELLRSYRGCKECRSKEVDAYSLYENSWLVCWVCLVKKEGGSSSPISFSEQSKWYRRHWRINISEWLENFSRLPVNKNCADKWLKDKKHLENCDCLEIEAQELYLLFSGSLQRYQEQLKDCQCETSEKVRVDSDYYAWCERCEESIMVASKKRVIKNRNDPKFWGVESEWRVLCLECIGKEFYRRMEEWQRKKFREYRRRGYV